MSRRNQERRVFDEHGRPQEAGGAQATQQLHDIFAIGASAGAIEALTALVGALPADFPGTLFIVVHTSPDARSKVPQVLGRAGALPVVAPQDMTVFAPSRIYVSSPDRHMLLERDHVRIVR